MKIKEEKPCKRKKCPYYLIHSSNCSKCELNPNSGWTVKK